MKAHRPKGEVNTTSCPLGKKNCVLCVQYSVVCITGTRSCCIPLLLSMPSPVMQCSPQAAKHTTMSLKLQAWRHHHALDLFILILYCVPPRIQATGHHLLTSHRQLHFLNFYPTPETAELIPKFFPLSY